MTDGASMIIQPKLLLIIGPQVVLVCLPYGGVIFKKNNARKVTTAKATHIHPTACQNE